MAGAHQEPPWCGQLWSRRWEWKKSLDSLPALWPAHVLEPVNLSGSLDQRRAKKPLGFLSSLLPLYEIKKMRKRFCHRIAERRILEEPGRNVERYETGNYSGFGGLTLSSYSPASRIGGGLLEGNQADNPINKLVCIHMPRIYRSRCSRFNWSPSLQDSWFNASPVVIHLHISWLLPSEWVIWINH